MKPSWTVTSADGCELAGYELGGVGDDVLLIAHATGLCGAMYQLLADELTDTFPRRGLRLPRPRRLDTIG